MKLLADPTYPIKPKTLGQKVRKKRMDLGLQVKDLAKHFGVNQGTIINWELREVKPSRENFEKAKTFLKE